MPAEGRSDADLAREHTALFRTALAGAGIAPGNPRMTGSTALLPVQPQSPGLADRVWWGSGTRETARWTAEQGMNLMSSTLLEEDRGIDFGDLQAEQIAAYREAWAAAGWTREPRVSVSRSVLPIVNDLDRRYFGPRAARDSADQVGSLDGVTTARFGKSYVGDPAQIAEDLAKDAAVREADTLLLTVPNQLGVDYNVHLLSTIAEHIAPALGWRPHQGATARV